MKIILVSLYGRSAMIHYSSQLANALCRKNDVYAIIPTYSNTGFFDKRVKLIRINAPPSVLKTFFLSLNLFNFLRIKEKIREINPDIVHILDNHPWNLVFLHDFKKHKLIITQHDVSAHPGEYLRGKITIYVNDTLNRNAKKIIVHGEKLKKDLASKGTKNDKIAVMPFGDFSFFLKWKKDNIKEEKHTILFFGRILHYKGLDILLKALKDVKKEVNDVKLVIAGEGDIAPYQKLIDDDICKNIEIYNEYIPEKDVPKFFQKSSIIAMPYREASQSGIIPIAYAFKKAVICTDVGSLSEVVDDKKTGIIIPPLNRKRLADAIIDLLKDDKKRKDVGINGYKKMRKTLRWDKIAEKLMKIYKEE